MDTSKISFVVIFTFEMLLKVFAHGFFGYCRSLFNIFDLIVSDDLDTKYSDRPWNVYNIPFEKERQIPHSKWTWFRLISLLWHGNTSLSYEASSRCKTRIARCYIAYLWPHTVCCHNTPVSRSYIMSSLLFQVVLLSILELILRRINDNFSYGLSVLRCLRLLRAFKVTK